MSTSRARSLVTEVDDRPGGMARLSRSLADAGVNIHGHLFLGRWGDRAMFAFVVDKPDVAARSSSEGLIAHSEDRRVDATERYLFDLNGFWRCPAPVTRDRRCDQRAPGRARRARGAGRGDHASLRRRARLGTRGPGAHRPRADPAVPRRVTRHGLSARPRLRRSHPPEGGRSGRGCTAVPCHSTQASGTRSSRAGHGLG